MANEESAVNPIELEVTGKTVLAGLASGDIVKKFGKKAGDTGASEVQIALLTQKIEEVAAHAKKFQKDLHSQRGMMRMISQRKRLLSYLKREDFERYKKAISALGLRK